MTSAKGVNWTGCGPLRRGIKHVSILEIESVRIWSAHVLGILVGRDSGVLNVFVAAHPDASKVVVYVVQEGFE